MILRFSTFFRRDPADPGKDGGGKSGESVLPVERKRKKEWFCENLNNYFIVFLITYVIIEQVNRP